MSDAPVTLFPYQERARDFLAPRRAAYLADVPRLGKTDAALAAAVLHQYEQLVIICPAAVRTAWRRKCAQYGLDDALVMSYEGAVGTGYNTVCDRLRQPHSLLILDEAHYLANRTALRTKKILGMAGPARLASTVWCLSGTPMAKHPGQLFPILASLFPGTLRALETTTYQSFLDRFTWGVLTPIWGGWGGSTYKPMGVKRAPELHEALFHGECPPFLRRVESEVEAEFPPLTWEFVPLDAESARQALAKIDTEALGGAVAARQVAGAAKVPLVLEMAAARLSDPSTGPLVLMAHFQSSLDALEDGLAVAGHTVVRLDGRTPPSVRDESLRLFQAGEARVFLGSIRACQTGITLDAAHEVWIVEPDWTADVNVQAGKRAFSLNQRRPCLTKLFVLAGSIDESILRSHERELAMHGAVLDPSTPEPDETMSEMWV